MSDDAYSEAGLRDTLDTAGKWYEAFALSEELARLSEGEQRNAGAVIQFFAQYTYTHLGSSPAEWKPGDVFECCTEILPRKVSAEASFFDAISPVLSAFFSFLGRQGLLANGHALAEVATDADEEIISNAQDTSNWGPAKHLVMAAHEAGVDIQDHAALQAFLLEFKLRQMARSSFVRQSSYSGQGFGPEERPFKEPANRYGPCPCGSGKKYKFCCGSNG